MPLWQTRRMLSAQSSDLAMSLLDSKSEFDSRAQQVGLVEEVLQGIASLAQLGFAAGTPGTAGKTSPRAWAGETLTGLSVPAGQEIALRRLLFIAHTLIIASLKKKVARESSASEVARKLPPVERAPHCEPTPFGPASGRFAFTSRPGPR